LKTRAAKVALRVQRQHDEIVATQKSHHHHRAFERDDELAQTTEPCVRSRTLSTAHQRSELRCRNVEIRFQAGFAENFFNSDAVRSHYERTEAALGASNNVFKHFLEHVASN